jgi:uncharacterized protein Smg (DUF494 family)
MRFHHQFRMLGSTWARAAAEERAEEPDEQLAEESAEQSAEDDSKPSTPYGEPKFIIYSDKVVQTLNFAAAYAIHGRVNPDCKYPKPWCGGYSPLLYQSYGGPTKRRFLVMPDGPDGYQDVNGQQVPVAKNMFTISVNVDGTLSNIDDLNNLNPDKPGFDHEGAKKAFKILEQMNLYGEDPNVKKMLQYQQEEIDLAGLEAAREEQRRWQRILNATAPLVHVTDGVPITMENWVDKGLEAPALYPWIPHFETIFELTKEKVFNNGPVSPSNMVRVFDVIIEKQLTPNQVLTWLDEGIGPQHIPIGISPATLKRWLAELFGETRPLVQLQVNNNRKAELMVHNIMELNAASLSLQDVRDIDGLVELVRGAFISKNCARAAKAIGYVPYRDSNPWGDSYALSRKFLDWVGEDLGRRAGWFRRKGEQRSSEVVEYLLYLNPGENVHEAEAILTRVLQYANENRLSGFLTPYKDCNTVANLRQLAQKLGVDLTGVMPRRQASLLEDEDVQEIGRWSVRAGYRYAFRGSR